MNLNILRLLAPANSRKRIRWQFSPLGKALIDPDELELSSLLSPDRVEVVKSGPHRTVCRLRLKKVAIYLKHCRIWTIRSFLRECLRAPKARLEFDRALELTNRGVGTIQPLAWGVLNSWIPGESFLISEELEDTISLNRYYEERNGKESTSESNIQDQELALGLGAFIAHIHNQGVLHPDLHPGNILFRKSSKRDFQFFLLDLHDIVVGHPLSRNAALSNLILLNRWASLRIHRTDRYRFWESYREHRTLQTERSEAKNLEEQTWESNLRFWRSRDQRCLGNNRYFGSFRSTGFVGHAVKEVDKEFLHQLLQNPDQPFEENRTKLLKNSKSSTVVEISVPTPQGVKQMIYKRFRVTKWYDSIVNFFRKSPTVRSWQMGHGLLDRLLPTPRPCIAFHKRRWRLKTEGYLLCEKVENAIDLHSAINQLSQMKGAEAKQRKFQLIDRTAKLLRDLHDRRLSHRDLKPSNILVTRFSTNSMQLWFIDLVGVRVCQKLSPVKRAQNLARLNSSFLSSTIINRTDKLRFLLRYLGSGLHSTSKWKDWWKWIETATKRKIHQNQKRGRPLI